MSALDLLNRKLRNLNKVALARLRLGDSMQMRHEFTLLKQWVGGAVREEEANSNTIDAALRALIERKYLKGARQIRLVCYGCTQAIGKDSLRLIESREYFDLLLRSVAEFGNRIRPLRKFYRGLLNSYFACDPQAPWLSLVGRENREALRLFLRQYLESVLAGGSRPDWLMTLGQHPNLLDEDPCQFYAASALQGDWSEFNAVREQLEISTESWLVREMVMAPIRAVADMADDDFKDNVDNILLLLNTYPLYATTGLQIMLDRYAHCKEREVSDTLGEYAVGLWGNPWLPENAHQWQCGRSARKLLTHWLKRHLLKQYFALLCNEGSASSRRFEFWDLYSESLSGMYFALGKDAFAVGNMPLYKFRHLAKGLIARLTEGKADVHACIMQFEHYHVVEFNLDSGAAYFYDTRQGTPPFYLSKGWVEIGALNVAKVTQGVDVSRLSKPLAHQDTDELAWEGRFARELGLKDKALHAFCRHYQCRLESREGCQWLRPAHPTQYGSDVWSVLQGWGYTFSAAAGAYSRPIVTDANR